MRFDMMRILRPKAATEGLQRDDRDRLGELLVSEKESKSGCGGHW